jgi:hypothetical protein
MISNTTKETMQRQPDEYLQAWEPNNVIDDYLNYSSKNGNVSIASSSINVVGKFLGILAIFKPI